MGAYDAARALAIKLLGKKGKSVVLTRKGNGAPDPLAGTRGAGVDVTAVFNCLGLPPGKSAERELGSLVGRNIIEFHMARTAGALDPRPGDLVPWGGKTWTLAWVAGYDPDDSGVFYTKAYGEA